MPIQWTHYRFSVKKTVDLISLTTESERSEILTATTLNEWPQLGNTRGGAHMLRYIRRCDTFLGHFFLKKSLNMGPIFHAKISNYGSDFQSFENLECFCGKISKNVFFFFFFFFFWKNPKHWYLFWKTYPWTWVWLRSCRRHIPDQSKSEKPSPSGVTPDKSSEYFAWCEKWPITWVHVFVPCQGHT